MGNKGGAPKGSKNALGNKGGHGGPFGNKKAVTTGEHETIWFDMLDEDEQELLAGIDTDPIAQANESITLLTIRERRMLQRIKRLTDGLTENQKRVLQQLKSFKEIIEVHDEKSGKTSKVPVTRNKMVEAEIEETTYRVIDDILKLEDALTRVQDKKLKAIELKNRLTVVDEEKEVRTAILQIELQSLQGGAGATQSWTEALKEIAERRKAKRAEASADE
nr:phage terminase small subunit [Paenibacillus roseus]